MSFDLPSAEEARKASKEGAKRTEVAVRKQREEQRKKEKEATRQYVEANLEKFRAKIASQIKEAISVGKTDVTVTFHEFHGFYFKDSWLFEAVEKAVEALPEGYHYGISSNETAADEGYPSSITLSLLIYWGEKPPERPVNAWTIW